MRCVTSASRTWPSAWMTTRTVPCAWARRSTNCARWSPPLPDKLQQLEQRDPNSVTFTQAAKLVGMGASVEELTRTCGLTQAEAELMSKLHRSE